MAALPPSASVAHAQDGGKLHAPSADRNVPALLSLLHDHAPRTGSALEIASGTGQHISAFAAAFPDLQWHPSERDLLRLTSIDAYASQAALRNIAPALALDISQPDWGAGISPKALIFCSNLTHLIPTSVVKNLITEAARALEPVGKFILYGPFKRAGRLTSEGDARFDAELRGADPAIGYKDDLDILRWLGDAGLTQVDTVQMPANNLAFIAGHPDP